MIVPVLSLQGVEAVRYEWRSWQSQLTKDPKCQEKSRPCVRAQRVGEPEPIIKVAARAAFWSLEKSFVVKLLQHEGYEVEAGKTLFDTLVAAVGAVLELNEAESTKIVHQRLVQLKEASAYTAEMLHCDEAAQVMEPADMKEMRDESKRAVECHKELAVFKTEYKAARQRQRTVGRSGSGGPRKAKALHVRTLLEASTISHSSIKAFVLAGAHGPARSPELLPPLARAWLALAGARSAFGAGGA